MAWLVQAGNPTNISSIMCFPTGLGLDLPIRLEPGLFEWLGWYKLGMPKWMTPQEYKEAGFNIDTSYKPFQQISKYNMEENTDQYYGRCHDITSKVLKLHEKAGEWKVRNEIQSAPT